MGILQCFLSLLGDCSSKSPANNWESSLNTCWNLMYVKEHKASSRKKLAFKQEQTLANISHCDFSDCCFGITKCACIGGLCHAKNPKAPFRLTNSCFSWLWQRIYIMPSLQIKTSLSTCAYGDPAEKQKGHICWMQVTNLNRSFAFAQERFFFKSKPFLTCMFVTVPCKSFLFAHGSQNLSF